jgi:signal transduction histidine kinase
MKEEFLKGYIDGLKEMVSITNHKVRQPVANIIGMAYLIDEDIRSPEVLKKITGYMRQSAVDLEAFTRELTDFIYNLEQQESIKRIKRNA